jgi:tetrahydromethanopterin S-methyltransferase subunit H
MFGATSFAEVPFASLADGVIYDRSLAETVTVQDSVAALLDMSPAVNDTVTLSESLASNVDFVGSVAEAASYLDALAGNIDFVLAIAETAAFVESVTIQPMMTLRPLMDAPSNADV